MAGFNKVQLIGNLGKDPTLTETSSKMPICKFGLATTEKKPDGNNGYKDDTQWHNVTIFGKQAEVAAKFLHKGSKIYLEGRIEYGSYTAKDGTKRYTSSIIGNKFIFLDGKSSGGGNSGYSRDNHKEEDMPW